MAGIALTSVDEFIAFMILAGEEERIWALLDLNKLNVLLPVRIKDGSKNSQIKGYRDGRADIFTAKFIQNLQKNSYWIFKEIGAVSAGGRKNALRVAISQGSDDLKQDWSEVLKEAIRKLDSKHLLLVLSTLIIIGGGYFTFKNYRETELESMRLRIQAELEIERIQQRQNEQNALFVHEERLVQRLLQTEQCLQEYDKIVSEAFERAQAQSRDPEYPIRGYIKSMRQKETISVDEEIEYTKKEALDRLHPISDEAMFYVHGDGNYALRGLDLIDGTQAIVLTQGDSEKVTTLLERLDPETRQEILSTVDKSLESRETKHIDLQVDVYFTRKKIHHAVLIGVGKARGDMQHFSFENIPQSVPSSEWRSQGTSN